MTKTTANVNLLNASIAHLSRRVAALEGTHPIVRQSLVDLHATLSDCIALCQRGLDLLNTVLEKSQDEFDKTDRNDITETLGSNHTTRTEYDR